MLKTDDDVGRSELYTYTVIMQRDAILIVFNILQTTFKPEKLLRTTLTH